MAAPHSTTFAGASSTSGRSLRIDPRADVRVTIDRGSGLELSSVSTGGGRATVQVAGEMDLSNADLLASLIDEEVRRGRRLVRLDLSRLTFCDCAGLRAIVQAHERLLRVRGSLVLIGARSAVFRLLELIPLDEALVVADANGGAHRGD